MFRKEMIEKMIPRKLAKRGEKIFSQDLVHSLQVKKQPSCTQVSATVSTSDSSDSYDVSILLSQDCQFIMDAQCTCPAYEEDFECEHIGAVLHAFASFEEKPDEAVSVIEEKESDNYVRHFLKETEQFIDDSSQNDGQYSILPSLLGNGDKPHSVNVEFRVGSSILHMYVIRSISHFCSLVNNAESYRYGKDLELVHKPSAFAKDSQPMLKFLLSITQGNDSYRPSIRSYLSTWYYDESASQEIKRNLSLKGIYLDRFMQAFIPLCTSELLPVPYTFKDGICCPSFTIEKQDQGLLLKGAPVSYYQGEDYIYVINHSEITRCPLKMELMPVLNCLESMPREGLFFSEKDIPAFASSIYPLLEKYCTVKNNGFTPDKYRPEKPQFEVYLDLPQPSLLTCKITASYKDKHYNIISDEVTDLASRNLPEERKASAYAETWFSSVNRENGQFEIEKNEEKTYMFLKDGIPALQEKYSVFITDKLKKISLKKTKDFHMNVSAGTDLLQLSLFSTDLSSQEITEILNHYNPKQKFYRLKNGTLIETDKSFEQIYNLKESLGLSAKELVNGKAEQPLYRAVYLDHLKDSVSFEMEEDNSFSSLVDKINSVTDKEYTLPEGMQVDLRPYQMDGYRWLCALKDNHFGGLLADEMGLGKTLQVIALMGSDIRNGKCLVVCPASLVYNWASEISRFMPALKSRIISGTTEERKELIQASTEDEILITSYDLLKRDIEYYEDQRFDIEVIDEAQYIKNARTNASLSVKGIHASFRIALTGTPIENRLSELWSIFDYILPGFFSTYPHFRNQFELPIVRDEDDLVQHDLNSMISPFILRRLKKNVLKDLPDKLEQVYYAKLEGEQKKLYEARVSNLKDMLEHSTDQQFRKNRIAVLAELTRLRQICCEPSLLYENYRGNSAKKEMCLDMIREATEAGHKVLLFSQFTTMLDEMMKLLDENHISYHLITGATPKMKRVEMVESFKTDDVPVFCISLKAGGTGLNLTAADVVIHYDPWWNTAVENQATDRAHRIGQTNVVSVYRLIMKDTIEERIIEMQNQKKDLADSILSSDGISSSTLTRDDLLKIL